MRRYVALSLLLPPKRPLTCPNNGLPLLALGALDRGFGLYLPQSPALFNLYRYFLHHALFQKPIRL